MSTMEAGRNLDALVAEVVMGWTKDDRGSWVPPGMKPLRVGYYTDKPGRYSIDIAAAWEVVERLRASEDGYDFELNFENGAWECWFPHHMYDAGHAVAETAPLAIVRAALSTVEES